MCNGEFEGRLLSWKEAADKAIAFGRWLVRFVLDLMAGEREYGLARPIGLLIILVIEQSVN